MKKSIKYMIWGKRSFLSNSYLWGQFFDYLWAYAWYFVACLGLFVGLIECLKLLF